MKEESQGQIGDQNENKVNKTVSWNKRTDTKIIKKSHEMIYNSSNCISQR